MKLKLIFAIVLPFCFTTSAWAQVRPWGLGVIINSPTGFSVKHRMSASNSFDAALGYSFGKSDNLSAHATYLWEFNRGIPLDGKHLGYYFGVGGAFFSRDKNESPPSWAEDNRDDEFGVAIRGSSGINYYFSNPNIEVFAELALNFFFVPATEADFDIAIGGRYFF